MSYTTQLSQIVQLFYENSHQGKNIYRKLRNIYVHLKVPLNNILKYFKEMVQKIKQQKNIVVVLVDNKILI